MNNISLKYILLILIILVSIFSSAHANIYSRLDIKIKHIIQKISSNHQFSPQQKIKITQTILLKLSLYKNKKTKLKIPIEYISSKFEKSLLELQLQYSNQIQNIIETGPVLNYKVLHKEFKSNEIPYFIIRSFTQNNTTKYLIINSQSFQTSIITSSSIYQFSNYGNLYNNSKYKKIQNYLTSQQIKSKNIYQNYGLHKSLSSNDNKVYITADFCPSGKHGFEKKIFTKYQNTGHKNISVAITQAWIDGHPQDFEYIKTLNTNNSLNISWVNHTKTHLYQPGVAFKNNFILSNGLQLEDEILTVEKTLIKHGQLPSIFLRFPGLVSDKTTRESVIKHYGLIPLGSNAWLAKGEQPTSGSIILIHGNKNEPIGIQKMNYYLDNNKSRAFGDIHEVLHEK